MNLSIVLLIVVGILFVTTYITRRRFGVLGLALCAGYLLSIMWATEVNSLVRELIGIDTPTPSLTSLVAVSLVLSPAILVLLGGPVYHKKTQRLIGSVAFAVLAAAFMLTPLGNSVNFDSTSKTVYKFLSDNRDMIITAGIGYAFYDLMTYRVPKKDK